MRLDVGTLFVTGFAGCVMLGILMLLAWWQNRDGPALAWWGAAYLLGSVGILLPALRGSLSPFIAIDLGNAALLASYGLLWIGTRRFDGKSLPFVQVGGSALLWLVLCRIPVFYDSSVARIFVVSGLIATYSLVTALALWQGRAERLSSRGPAVVVFTISGAAFLLRIAFARQTPFPTPLEHSSLGFSVLALVSILCAIASAFILMSLTKERAEVAQRRAATVDPLTGIFNRRAFFERAERIVHRATMDGSAVAVLMFDLDHFKQVNDRYGHPTGDRMLVEFSQLAMSRLRGNDLFGRIGGEEFAAILPGASRASAVAAAERIRKGFSAMIVEHGDRQVSTTVSVGVSTLGAGAPDLDRLIASADRALYQAKRAGRDTVQVDAAAA